MFIGTAGMNKMFLEAAGYNGAQLKTYQVIGFIDDDENLHGRKIYGFPVLGSFSELATLIQKYEITDAFVCLGLQAMQRKKEYFLQMKDLNLASPSAIHPKAIIEKGVHIGEGVLITAGVTINVDTWIGNNVFISTGTAISHDCIIEDHCYISPGTTLCGYTHIGNCTFIGAGTTILPRIRVGRNSIVGAGSLVNSSIPDNVVAFGAPAKIIRENTPQNA